MKKALSIVITLILIACAVNSTSLYSVSALNEVSDIDEYKYVFPAINDDELQLTDVELQSDTVTLLNLILESNWINPLVSSTPNYTEYPYMTNRFNGLQELEKRTDAGTVMVQQYMEECAKGDYTFRGDQLYALLIQDVFVNKLTAKEARVFQIANDCYRNQIKWRIVTAS